MRLASGSDARFESRVHFLRAAALVMRRILINHARDQRAQKRGGGRGVLRLEEVTAALPDEDVDLLALDEALERLAAVDQQKARVVELRFFAGCSVEETAEALEISTATVGRDWRFARAWLRSAIREGAG